MGRHVASITPYTAMHHAEGYSTLASPLHGKRSFKSVLSLLPYGTLRGASGPQQYGGSHISVAVAACREDHIGFLNGSVLDATVKR